ncbi:unnamed protein product [Linum trigynum]|uniref:RNase H type-1 domain-containing protein n=1 Tax=Linum trigynum TaxID=586398 RepID=A0AAV2FTC8_9ROSI
MEEDEVIHRDTCWVQDYLKINSTNRNGTHARSGITTCWKWPSSRVYKLNTDVGVSEKEGIRIGGIIQDWNGVPQFAFTRRMVGNCRLGEAEARGILREIEEALSRGFTSLIVESDCKVIIERLKNREDDRPEIRVLCELIWLKKEMAEVVAHSEERQISWEFSPHETNKLAHYLAHVKVLGQSFYCWDSWIPNWLYEAV